MHLLLLSALVACDRGAPTAPPQIEGLWQVHQVERTSGLQEGRDAALAPFPGCVWARQTWNFQTDRIRVEHDVLCPSSQADEFVACEVAAEVPAVWDAGAGRWKVAHGARARSRTGALEPSAFEVPTSCTVSIEAGEYPVARIPGEEWRWEMAIPSGPVLRLRIPDSAEPDFVLAMREVIGTDEEAP